MKRPALLPLLLFAIVGAYGQPVDYAISARLDDVAGLIRGSETIRYRNLTPDTLGSIWLHLYPNAFRDRSTTYARELESMGRFDFSLSRTRDHGWVDVDWVESGGRVTLMSETGTELGLFLNPPLAPGESVTVSLGFDTKVPSRFGELARSGRSFVLAHWYPEVAARTPQAGWLLGGYHVFGHSPSAFADYHVTLDLARGLNVFSSAAYSELPNPGPGRQAMKLDATDITGLAMVIRPDTPGDHTSAAGFAGTSVVTIGTSTSSMNWSTLMTIGNILRQMQKWNGPFPYSRLFIVDGTGIVARDASYPGLIIMASPSIPYTRSFELALAQQIALQWSACATGADELGDPGVAQGPAAYSAMRYMDEKYGRTSLVSNPLLRWLLTGLSSEYYNKLYYYVGASNKVLCNDLTECRDQVGYQASAQSGPALQLLAAERRLGRPAFDSLMRNWMGREWGLSRENRDASAASSTLPHRGSVPHFPGQFELDSAFGLRHSGLPDSVLPTRLGDHSVTVRPIFALPSFSTYQIFYGPYAWVDAYHGFQLCGWAQGRQFYDAGPLRGRHQWTVSEIYSTHIRDWHSSVNYQTPLTFVSDRLRVYAALDYSLIDYGAKLYFSQELGPVFRQPKTTIDLGYRILQVKNDTFRDPRAWELGRTADIRVRVAQTYESRLMLGSAQAYARNGMTVLGSEENCLRIGLEQSHTWRGLRPYNLTLRMFAGYIWGRVLAQDQFYLSGGLSSNAAEPVSWGYEGISSGQEHWHYEADVNCRGWAGEYLHGRAAYGLNFKADLVKLGLLSVSPFFDLGNVGDSLIQPGFLNPRMDAGITLKLGPLYADFPIWRYQIGVGKHQFAFRWMLGLKMGGNLGSS
jgi:hypothetical protein